MEVRWKESGSVTSGAVPGARAGCGLTERPGAGSTQTISSGSADTRCAFPPPPPPGAAGLLGPVCPCFRGSQGSCIRPRRPSPSAWETLSTKSLGPRRGGMGCPTHSLGKLTLQLWGQGPPPLLPRHVTLPWPLLGTRPAMAAKDAPFGYHRKASFSPGLTLDRAAPAEPSGKAAGLLA